MASTPVKEAISNAQSALAEAFRLLEIVQNAVDNGAVNESLGGDASRMVNGTLRASPTSRDRCEVVNLSTSSDSVIEPEQMTPPVFMMPTMDKCNQMVSVESVRWVASAEANNVFGSIERRDIVDLCSSPVKPSSFNLSIEVEKTKPPGTPLGTVTSTIDRLGSAKKIKREDFEFSTSPSATPPIDRNRSAKKIMTASSEQLTTAFVTNANRSAEKASPSHSSFASKIDGFTRRVRHNWSQMYVDDQAELGREDNTIEIILFEVKTKPSRIPIESAKKDARPRWNKLHAGILKLYEHKETGVTRIVQRNPAGQVKLNLSVRGNVFNLEKYLLPKKVGRAQIGCVSFYGTESEKIGKERFILSVNVDMLDKLYEKLIEMGARTT